VLGVKISDIFNALQSTLGGFYVNDFNLFGRTFRVTAQALDKDRQHVSDVLKIRVRNSSGETVPLGSFTTVDNIAGPYRVPRYNLYPAAEIDGAAAPGYSQGQAIAIMDKPRNGRRLPSSRSKPAIPQRSLSCWRWSSFSSCWPRNTRA
jgi:multidrug efflux pump subunit AcrB